MTTRIEKDSMGEMSVPADAYYGAQTARALQNFPISGLKPHPLLCLGYGRHQKMRGRGQYVHR